MCNFFHIFAVLVGGSPVNIFYLLNIRFMKKTITLLSFLLLSYVAIHAQVNVMSLGSGSKYWLTFMMQNNRQSGDLLYSKTFSQPTSGVNSFNVVMGRYNMTTATETMTITLRGIEGSVYDWGMNLSLSINGLTTDNVGNIYVAGANTKKVYRFNAPSQTSGDVTLDPAAVYTIATGYGGHALAVDGSGNLYIGDSGPNVYRVLAENLTSNVTVTSPFLTIANGSVYDIDFDGPGNIYISTSGTSIQKYSATGLPLSTITYSDSKTNIFSSAVASDGTVFFTTGNNNAIAKYSPVTNTTSVFAGVSGVSGDEIDASTTTPYTNARFKRVTNLAFGANGNLLAYDESNYKVYRIVAGVTEVTLPLFLTNFNVAVVANATNYKWTMASQADVVKYVLQSSTDGKTFKEITTVLPVQSQLTYNYTNNSFQPGIYVRLKIVYGNREEEFSDVQFIKNELDKNQFQAGLTIGRLTIKNEIPGNYTIKIIDLNGRVVFNEAHFLEKGANFISLNYGIVNNANLYVINCTSARQNYLVKTIVN